LRDTEWTRLLGWPGYLVYHQEIDEKARTLKLWVRRKPGTKKRICSGCGKHVATIHELVQREIRDLPWSEYKATVVVELCRLRCPDCGPRIEKVAQLPSKAPFSKRFEDAVGGACQGASAIQVAKRFGLSPSTVRAIDLRCLERWAASRRKPTLKHLGVDELYLGKSQKFIMVASNLETGEPLWFGLGRKRETLDEFFASQLRASQRRRIEAACVDMWPAFKSSIEQWAPQCAIVYDKFHIIQHANKAVDEVRRSEFHRQGGWRRKLVKGKRWLLLTRWMNLSEDSQKDLNQLFRLNRRIMKAFWLKESLEELWSQPNAIAAATYLDNWVRRLRWQRLPSFEKLARMLLDHREGLLNHYKVRVRFGVVEAINGNLRILLRRGRGYRNLRYLLLKAQHMAATKTELVVFKRAA
jgi:transposase